MNEGGDLLVEDEEYEDDEEKSEEREIKDGVPRRFLALPL